MFFRECNSLSQKTCPCIKRPSTGEKAFFICRLFLFLLYFSVSVLCVSWEQRRGSNDSEGAVLEVIVVLLFYVHDKQLRSC